MSKYLYLVFIIIFSGCAKVGLFTVNMIADARGLKKVVDLEYGKENFQKLNVYFDKHAKKEELKPVIVFFYGGDWSTGAKDDYGFVAEAFTSNGYIVVVPDYSKYPEHLYPAFMEDSAKAVGWVYNNIGKYGGDKNKIVLMGHSAGAFISTLLTTNKKFLADVAVPHNVILGDVGMSGPYDFVPGEKKYQEIFAAAGGDASSAMPATYIDGTQPPILLIHGLKDELVDLYNVTRMQERVKKYGGDLQCKLYDDVTHSGTIAALAAPLRGRAATLKDINIFLEQLLNK